MDSFYSGKPGISFVLRGRFDSIDAMRKAFAKGADYKDVWYEEYCIIDTPNKNDKDNGKIFQRGLDYQNSETNGAIYVGQVVGPSSGTPYFQLNTLREVELRAAEKPEDYTYKRYPIGYEEDSEGHVIGYKTSDGDGSDIVQFPFSLGHDTSIVPGKYEEDGVTKYHDEIKWTWCNLRKDNADADSWFYVGFEIPYTITDYQIHQVSPYDEHGNIISDATDIKLVTPTKTDDPNYHPYYAKWDIGLPKGIKGDTLRYLRVMVPTNSTKPEDGIYDPASLVVNQTTGEIDASQLREYADKADDVRNNRQILVFDYYVYDQVINPKPIHLYLGDYNVIDSITLADNGTLTIGYTHDDDTIYSRKIKWISNLTLNANTGQFTVTYNNGDPAYSTQLDWVDNVYINEANGEIAVRHVNAALNTSPATGTRPAAQVLAAKLKLITSVSISSTGVMTIGTNTGETMTVTDASGQPYRVKILESISLAGGASAAELVKDKHIFIKYNTETEAQPIGDSINYIQDMKVRYSDWHLMVLYSDPNHRAITADLDDDLKATKIAAGTERYKNVYGTGPWVASFESYEGSVALSNGGEAILWRDYGSIKDQSGILIGFNVTEKEVEDSSYNTIVDYLNGNFPYGLTGEQNQPGGMSTKGKIVTYTVTKDDVTKTYFYAFDYSKPMEAWYSLGEIVASELKDAKLATYPITNDDKAKVSPEGLLFTSYNYDVSTTAMPKMWLPSYAK